MNSIKQRSLLILFIFQQFILSVFCYSHPPDFIIEEGSTRPVLRQTLRIPVGSRESASNSPHLSRYGTPYVDVPEGTLLYEIPSIITQRREELGLSSQIPLDQQNEFFQNLTWSRLLSFGTFPIIPPIPGRVRQILTEKGQRVAKGTPLCIVEAMKMEMVLRAPYPGKIHQILTQENSLIDTNNVLIVLEPSVPFWETLDPSLIAQHRDFFFSFFPWERILPEENEPTVTVAPVPTSAGENTIILDQRENTTTLDLALTHASFPNPQPVEMKPSLPVVSHEQPEILAQPIPAPMPPIDEESVQSSPTAKGVDEAQKPEQTISSPVLQNVPLIVTNTPEETKVKETPKSQQGAKPVTTPCPVEPQLFKKQSEPQITTPPTLSLLFEEPKLTKLNITMTYKPSIHQDQTAFSEAKPPHDVETLLERGNIDLKERKYKESQLLAQGGSGISSTRFDRFVLATEPFVILRQGKFCFSLENISFSWTKDLNLKEDFSTKKCLNFLCKLNAFNTQMTNGATQWQEAEVHGNCNSKDKETMNIRVATGVLTETWIPAFARMTVKEIAILHSYYLFDDDLVSPSTYTKLLGCLLVLGILLLSIKTFGLPSLLSPILSLGLGSFSVLSSIKLLKACHFNQYPLLKEFKGCNENYKPWRQKKNRVKRYAYLGLHGKLGQYCAA